MVERYVTDVSGKCRSCESGRLMGRECPACQGRGRILSRAEEELEEEALFAARDPWKRIGTTTSVLNTQGSVLVDRNGVVTNLEGQQWNFRTRTFEKYEKPYETRQQEIGRLEEAYLKRRREGDAHNKLIQMTCYLPRKP